VVVTSRQSVAEEMVRGGASLPLANFFPILAKRGTGRSRLTRHDQEGGGGRGVDGEVLVGARPLLQHFGDGTQNDAAG